ncbi:DUF72 domain-containing protein [Aromatoleum diolicum]|uniref:DUF72 domain-containing protein n=1 Tax=Aromatoleum diolicum TaxID=75796 RepID=A0ABX1QA62_9RHOO|nr:DUF72 domain-containing protein [Aromatoleum diolicum]NMG74910.1 DUF72 domain-containing protein [Aromatoleum diolicum]
MRLSTGTSGFSYKEWLGSFYPEKLPPDAMLHYYAERFTTVEINNTFYRMPDESMLARWAEQVPPEFSFTLKAPRRITHEQRLRESESSVTEFVRRAAALGDKLGVLLFQLPPFLRKDVHRLRDFLAGLPSDKRYAFEFRHASWQDDEVYEALRSLGALYCVTDTDEGETPFVATTECAYIRLRRTHYDDADLRAWVERIAAQPLTRAYVYFMHEDEALGTRFARRLDELWHEAGGSR